MRLRNVKGSRETLQASEYVIHQIQTHQGNFRALFGNSNPLHIEIGMGKGRFITELARRNPEINYIGIEKFSSVLVRALEKRELEPELKNLYFIRMDAEYIQEVFGKYEVDQIYLNFSDPWPKERHAKRRLTSREFFARYDQILIPEGEVIFKTDNRTLFDFSVEEIPEAGWKIRNLTYDLHHSIYMEGNVMTEYEEKFSSEGKPICRLTAYR